MRNITVSVSDETYIQARIWAAQRDTSVSAIVQYLLQTLPSVTRAVRAFPVRDPETSGTPTPSAKKCVFRGDPVDPYPTHSKQTASSSRIRGNT
jgi:hypothetical protein